MYIVCNAYLKINRFISSSNCTASNFVMIFRFYYSSCFHFRFPLNLLQNRYYISSSAVLLISPSPSGPWGPKADISTGILIAPFLQVNGQRLQQQQQQARNFGASFVLTPVVYRQKIIALASPWL